MKYRYMVKRARFANLTNLHPNRDLLEHARTHASIVPSEGTPQQVAA